MLTKKSPKEQTDIIIAASDTHAKGKLSADYVCGVSGADVEFQNAIDRIGAINGGTIKVLAGNYIFNRCVRLRGNLRLIFEPGAVVKIANQISTNLTTNYSKNDTTVHVEDASGFLVGQDVGITKTSSTGYVVGYQRKITDINGNTITVETVDDLADEGTCSIDDGARLITHFSLFRTEGPKNIYIESGEFDGNKSNVPSWLQNKDSAQNFLLAGVGDNYLLSLKDMYIHDFRFQGIHPVGTSVGSKTYIENCTVSGCEFSGICIDSCDGPVLVKNCTCKNNGSFGIQSIVTKDVQIEGGYFIDNTLGGIYSGHFEYSTRNTLINGVTIIQSTPANTIGIALNGNMKNANVSNCIIRNCNKGIELSGAVETSYVQGNLIHACNNGVYEANDDSDYNVLGPNFYRQCASDVIKNGDHSFVPALLSKDGESPTTAYVLGNTETWVVQVVDPTVRTDMTIKTTMTLLNDYGSMTAQLCFRETFTAYPNWHGYALTITNNSWALTKRHADGVDLVGWAEPPVIDQGYDVMITVTGNVIKVYIDGVERMSYTDSTPIASGNVALHNYKCRLSYEGDGEYGIEIS
jgi:parallel beta-helix repeat protein